MPYKPGGGNHMQLYDKRNGEYTDQEKRDMAAKDDIGLELFFAYGEFSSRKFHFPLEGVHSDKYCKNFLEAVKGDIKKFNYSELKMDYLLSYQAEHDKSYFLQRIGYNKNYQHELYRDICKGTDISSLKFIQHSNDCFKCSAKTRLKGYLVKTIWGLNKDLSLRLITLIPGGDKIWDK